MLVNNESCWVMCPMSSPVSIEFAYKTNFADGKMIGMSFNVNYEP